MWSLSTLDVARRSKKDNRLSDMDDHKTMAADGYHTLDTTPSILLSERQCRRVITLAVSLHFNMVNSCRKRVDRRYKDDVHV